jgi:ATP-dependent RNA helicase RhlE
MSQNQRDRAMRGFRSRQFEILVATDIASRCIDVSGVSHVINYDVPNTPEAYTHRIGRTGRAELEGIACTFVTHSDRAWVNSTERMIGSSIPRRRVEGFETGHAEQAERPARRTSGSSRGGNARGSSNGGKSGGNSRGGNGGGGNSRGGKTRGSSDGAATNGSPARGSRRNTRSRDGSGRGR